jgi:hypothetical protein
MSPEDRAHLGAFVAVGEEGKSFALLDDAALGRAGVDSRLQDGVIPSIDKVSVEAALP